jgi:rhomboid protease GluP
VDKLQISILIGLALVLLTSIWAALDARKHRISTHGHAYNLSNGAAVWFLGCLVFWFVIFPSYLIRRRQVMRRQRCRAEAEAQFDQRLRESPEGDWNDPALAGCDPWDLVAIGHCQRLRGLEAVHLAPTIPLRLVHQAQKEYLRLEPEELLLAIIDPMQGTRPDQVFALTTRKIHGHNPDWKAAPTIQAEQGRDLGIGMPRFGLAFRGIAIPYTALGSRFATSEPAEEGMDTKTVKEQEPGPLRKLQLAALDRSLHASLCQFLDAVGPVARQEKPVLPTVMLRHASEILPALKRQAEQVLVEQQGLVDFQSALKTATRRAVVTPFLVLACVAVFAVMVFQGVSPVVPRIEDLLSWGANFGPYVAVDHEYWRLFTSMFLHIGFMHLLFNMWCLVAAGPMIERFFGNLGFAVIYLLSGLGGAVASMAVHPMLVGAGASGAIFGIFGALVGFLVVQHQVIPTTLLKPLRASATSFIAYNIFFGLTSSRIDNAAHLGGLATGFLCGLLLYRRLPIIPGRQGIGRRVLATAGLTLGLIVASRAIVGSIAADQQTRSASYESDRLATSYNELIAKLEKPTKSFDRISQEMNQLLERLRKTDQTSPGDAALVNRLVEQASADIDSVRGLPVHEPELQRIRDAFLGCERELRDALKLLHKLVAANLADASVGPESFQAKLEASNHAASAFVVLRDKFPKDHGLVAEASNHNRLPSPSSPRQPRNQR